MKIRTETMYISQTLLLSMAISGLNFISFVFMPPLLGINEYARFQTEMVIPGLFLFGLGNATIGVALRKNTKESFSSAWYWLIYISFALCFFAICLSQSTQSTAVLIANIELSTFGYMLVKSRLRNDQIRTRLFYAIQPLSFLLLIFFLSRSSTTNYWTVSYLSSASLALFLLAARGEPRRAQTTSWSKSDFTLGQLLETIMVIFNSCTIPLMIQLDILMYRNLHLNLGEFAIFSKIMYSIPIALTSILVLPVAKNPSRRNYLFMMLWSLCVCMMVTAAVLLINERLGLTYNFRMNFVLFVGMAVFLVFNFLFSVEAVLSPVFVFPIAGALLAVNITLIYFSRDWMGYLVFKLVLMSSVGLFLALRLVGKGSAAKVV